MGDKRYKAFISYSHADEAWGAWLQRSLERYRPPPALVRDNGAGAGAGRLTPVFRDREDLPVAGNLNAAIQAALADSDYQIVLCSPNAAKSRWVNEEIKLFHRLHGPGRTFALIIAGEPGAAAIPGREDQECFPPALRFLLDADGEITATPAEPLAADVREAGDGKRFAFLKVAAGMLGVGLDDLVRRDAARRARNLWAITGASLAGMAGAGALAFVAIVKSNEATLMRGNAENLIEFMLTDLKDKLEPVGSLDVLESVGDRAMAYYEGQHLKALNDDALARRTKAMLLLGQIDFRRNDLAAAQEAYVAAEAATGEQLRRLPNNPDRIFDHAQAVFYVGEAARSRRDLVIAERQMREYFRLAQELVAIDKNDPKWRLELAYATSNLGIVNFDAGDYAGAIEAFKKSIEARRTLLQSAPDNRNLQQSYAYALSWRALAELARGDHAAAAALFREQLAIYGADGETRSENFVVLGDAVVAQRRLAEAALGIGDLAGAAIAADAAAAIADRLLAREKENANWSINASHIERIRSRLAELQGDRANAERAAGRALSFADSVGQTDVGDQTFRGGVALALGRLIAVGGQASELAAAAARLDALLADLRISESLDTISSTASPSLALARHWKETGEEGRAAKLLTEATAPLARYSDRLTAAARIALAGLYIEQRQFDQARAIIADLTKTGVAHPDLSEFNQRIALLEK